MSDLDKAIARLEAAALELEQILADAVLPEPKEDPVLRQERDVLAAEVVALREEVAALREAAERDAELRAEAAEAVRAALSDLHALVPEEHSNG